jgi:hypothetical protein
MQVKTYSKKELRQLYNVSPDKFNKWLQEIETQLPHYKRIDKVLSPEQVRIIFQEYGEV